MVLAYVGRGQSRDRLSDFHVFSRHGAQRHHAGVGADERARGGEVIDRFYIVRATHGSFAQGGAGGAEVREEADERRRGS